MSYDWHVNEIIDFAPEFLLRSFDDVFQPYLQITRVVVLDFVRMDSVNLWNRQPKDNYLAIFESPIFFDHGLYDI